MMMGEPTVRVVGAGTDAGRINPGTGFPTPATPFCFGASVVIRVLTSGVLAVAVGFKATAGLGDSVTMRESWPTLVMGRETGRVMEPLTMDGENARVPPAEAARGASVAEGAEAAGFAEGAAFFAISEPIRDAGANDAGVAEPRTAGVNG
jgi:hypothetical protein